MSYERLIAEHGRIDMALGRLQRLIALDTPDAPAVTIALSDLSGELMAHLDYKNRSLYPRMIASANPHAVATAREFTDDFARLREDWRLYLGEWNSECIAADWAEFCHHSREIITRLTDRVRAEKELLYAAALQVNAIRLRRAA